MRSHNPIRQADAQYIIDCVASAKCCAVVGLSNIGKSQLLRSLSDVVGGNHALDALLLVYIDFNLMLDVSEQGFYEIILRSVLEQLELEKASSALIQEVHQAYRGVIEPASSFSVSLSFVEGIMTASSGLKRRLVLLFDEFDQPYSRLGDRVFLNLRALRDRYPQDICYVTATGQRLRAMRREDGAVEFAELFAHNVRFLQPLCKADAEQFVRSLIAEDEVALTQDQLDFLWEQAGGHLGLLEAAGRSLIGFERQEFEGLRDRQRLGRMHALLDDDLNVRTECAKLWNDLTESEHLALIRFRDESHSQDAGNDWDTLREKGIIIQAASGGWRVFGQVFKDFSHRQGMIRQRNLRGVRVDVEAGTVSVDGEKIPDLTDLEYRLLLLLYGNLNKTCDKYRIVEAVWSEEFLDEVDDARIEKLVSRLRQKIEPSPGEPRYLITVRGRGYRLVDPIA